MLLLLFQILWPIDRQRMVQSLLSGILMNNYLTIVFLKFSSNIQHLQESNNPLWFSFNTHNAQYCHYQRLMIHKFSGICIIDFIGIRISHDLRYVTSRKKVEILQLLFIVYHPKVFLFHLWIYTCVKMSCWCSRKFMWVWRYRSVLKEMAKSLFPPRFSLGRNWCASPLYSPPLHSNCQKHNWSFISYIYRP